MRRVLMTIVLLVAAPAWAVPPLCGPADDPCVVTQDLVVPGDGFLLGSRAFVVAAGRTITLADDSGFYVEAGSITLEAGAKIVAPGTPGIDGYGGYIGLTALHDVDLGPGSVLDVGNSHYAGGITISTEDGTVRLLGQIRGNATSRDGVGANVTISNESQPAGDVLIAGGGVSANGGNRYGEHGDVEVLATGNVTVLGPISVRGGSYGGGGIVIEADGDITTGPAADLDVTEFDAGEGSWVYFYSALGAITTDGKIITTNAGNGGGYAGTVELNALGPIAVRGAVETSGVSLYGAPGPIYLESEDDVTVDGNIVARGPVEISGMELYVRGRGNVLLNGDMDLRGGDGGASILIETEGLLRVQGTILYSGTYYGGQIELYVCDFELPAGARFENTSPSSPDITVWDVGGNATIGGTLRLGDPAVINYRDTPPVILPGAVVQPAPVLVLDPLIPCCHCAAACGDGRRDAGETCDDGNVADGDCCSSACQAESAGNACDDASTCTTDDLCDGAGRCVGAPIVCDVCERCDEGVGCVLGPKPACRPIVVPGSGQIDLKDRTPDTGDSLTWQWRRGAVTPLPAFGDPIGTHDYAMCVWNASGGLLLRATVPHGGVCGNRPCWKALGTRGFGYANSSNAPDGIHKMKLLSGAAGKASILVKGRGLPLQIAALGSVPLPVTAQLQASNGSCWESTHSIASMNVPAQLKAKSD